MEQQRATRLRERNISQFVDDDAIYGYQLPSHSPSVAFVLLTNQRIDEVDSIKKPYPFTSIGQGGAQRNGSVGLACAGSTYKNEVVSIFGELPRTERFNLNFGDS